MFVFVIDTSFMNVSISAVVDDLDTTVSGVQAAVAIEALVSAAFILIGSKLGDLFGRKRAYVVGLVLYAAGALAMVFAQGLAAIIVFWAVIGGLGAVALPARDAVADPRELRRQGAGEGLRAGRSVGRDRGGDRTADRWLRDDRSCRGASGSRSRRSSSRPSCSGAGSIRDVPYTGDRSIDGVGALLSVVGMGGLVVGVLVWQEGGESVGGSARGRGRGDGGPRVLAASAASAKARPRCSIRRCSNRRRTASGSPRSSSSRSRWAGC